MKKGCSRFLLIGLGIFVVLVIAWAILNFTGGPRIGDPVITISPETTIVDGPVNSNGDVDYAEYFNATNADGVTSENNAAVDLLRVFGPTKIMPFARERTFFQMRIDPLPIDGDYIRDFYYQLYEMKGADEIDGDQLELLEFEFEFASENAWTQKDAPDVAAWLDTNMEKIDQLRRMTDKPHWFVPIVDPDDQSMILFEGSLQLIEPTRAAARMLRISSGRNLAKEDIEAAFADTLAVRKLSRLTAQGPTTVDKLVAIAIDEMSAHIEIRIVRSGLATGEQLIAYRDTIATLDDLKNVAEAVNEFERMSMINLLTVIARGGIEGSEANSYLGIDQGTGLENLVRNSTDWSEAARVCNYWFDKLVDALSAETYAKRRTALDKFEEEFAISQERLGFGNFLSSLAGGKKAKGRFVAQNMLGIWMSATEAMSQAETRSTVNRRLMEISINLEIFKLDHQSYPDALEELAPEYINQLPLDTFTEKPFNYERTGESYLLYSSGPNMTDNGGQSGDESCDDVQIEYAPRTWDEFLESMNLEYSSSIFVDKPDNEEPLEPDAPETDTLDSAEADCESTEQTNS